VICAAQVTVTLQVTVTFQAKNHPASFGGIFIGYNWKMSKREITQ